ncbi:YxeA family protein [Paenibacillus alvei]|uniref:YxeA family protein n=1 Tax=Paenibacillus alvei TaxID=44250 RepID=A0ABT4GRI6_PAEAL|nr:YxeA family protein [Paenibacillus alvei]EJW18777.1 hypothetical protein PAV_2c05440 [Paenibacillus alvei DSM 29]MCY9539952.1 YxeA family protein [Paenibacillus alvei]MCY9707151.1 YxeA family protein [Paenibacillus alvei]MCY9733378.1 YxeA family protein [Paenibacillus alvei]MCY9753168.1 YxeA family protein [Paenibacillus alvei]
MKRIITLFAVITLFTSILVGCDYNRDGKQQYYVQTVGDPNEQGEYTLPAFDENGNEKKLTFMKTGENRKFKEHAFLRVYVKDEERVTAYEEISKDELPDKVKDKLNVK